MQCLHTKHTEEEYLLHQCIPRCRRNEQEICAATQSTESEMQSYSCGIRVYSVDVRHVWATCFGHKQIRKLFGQGACNTRRWVCPSGQRVAVYRRASRHRETHKEETREMCSCWWYKQHSSSRKSGEWRDSNFQQSSRLAKSGKNTWNFLSFCVSLRLLIFSQQCSDLGCHWIVLVAVIPWFLGAPFRCKSWMRPPRTQRLQSPLRVNQWPCGASESTSSSRSSWTAECAISIFAPKIVFDVGFQQLDRVVSVLKFCHLEQISHIEQISAWNVWSLIHVRSWWRLRSTRKNNWNIKKTDTAVLHKTKNHQGINRRCSQQTSKNENTGAKFSWTSNSKHFVPL